MASYDLMSVTDMLAAVGIAGLFLYFLIPTMVVVLTIYYIRRKIMQHKIKKKLKKQQKENQRKAQEEMNDDKKLKAKIDSLPIEPDDYSKFSKLALEFDEKGNIKE